MFFGKITTSYVCCWWRILATPEKMSVFTCFYKVVTKTNKVKVYTEGLGFDSRIDHSIIKHKDHRGRLRKIYLIFPSRNIHRSCSNSPGGTAAPVFVFTVSIPCALLLLSALKSRPFQQLIRWCLRTSGKMGFILEPNQSLYERE